MISCEAHQIGGGECRCESPSDSTGQSKRGHFLAVAHEQDIADQRRVVPGPAFDRGETRELVEPVGTRRDEGQLAALGQHEQDALLAQQDELAVAVTPAFPLTLAVVDVDTREDAAVEAVGVPLVHDEVAER